MQYRYQETLSWIVPGFYFIFFMVALILCAFPDSQASTSMMNVFQTNIQAGTGAMIVFAVPVFSFIIGWVVNGYAGYIFRFIMKWPTTDAYNDVFSTDVDGEKLTNFTPVNDIEAERVFDRARKVIDLEKVDRFYYRYVASRNMFAAQCFLCLIIKLIQDGLCLSWLFTIKSSCILAAFMAGSLSLAALFYFIVARDLNTHAKYVLVRYKQLQQPKKDTTRKIKCIITLKDNE